MTPWILLRGLAREGAHWGGFAHDLAQALPGAPPVLALDLPGNGVLHRATSPTTVQGMVQSARAALAARGLQPPYHVLALSLGAMVATEWARLAPAELTACVLVNTSLRPFSPFYQRLRPASYLPLLRCAWPGSSARTVERTVWQMTSNRAPAVAAVVDGWVAVRKLRPVSAANAVRQLLAAARYAAPTQMPLAGRATGLQSGDPAAARMLLLASAHDRLVSSRCSQAIASAWGVPLRMHPWAGHDLPLDDPQWVVAQIRSWLAERNAW